MRTTYEAEKRALLELGVSEAQAEAALAARAPQDAEDFELWLDNLEAFELFCALETQWRMVVGFGAFAFSGLRYGEATNLMRERGIRRARRAELLEDLRAMEAAALPVLNKRDDDD